LQIAARTTPRPLAESAVNWLVRHATLDGLAPTAGGAACPGLTAAAIPTLWSLGVDDLAIRFARRLARLQRTDGSLPDAEGRHASSFNTAQTARAFAVLDAAEALDEAAPACRRACDYLASRIAADGTIARVESGGSFERWAPQSVRLAGMATVVEFVEPHQQAVRRAAVRRAVEVVLRTTDVAKPSASLQVQLHGIEALLDLDAIEPRAGTAARRYLLDTAARQRRDGSVAADVAHRWTSSAGLAHLAALWYRVGLKEPADRALACLRSRQGSDGAWTGSWGRGAAYFPFSPSAWTVKYALDASLAEVRAAFDAEPPGLADPLGDEDGRLHAVVELVSQLPSDAELADVGCGGGRYLARLAEMFPYLRTTGVDPSTAALRRLPVSSTAVVGNVLRLPLADASYDAVVCIEALEHALRPERAVAEMCRVVRPGGRVLIIDKDRRFQGLSISAPWERWFDRGSVAAWLAPHCDEVTCTALPPGPHQRTRGLFLSWQGMRRRESAAMPIRRAA
jgi:malonyl-CoA O-methyltransferase